MLLGGHVLVVVLIKSIYEMGDVDEDDSHSVCLVTTVYTFDDGIVHYAVPFHLCALCFSL